MPTLINHGYYGNHIPNFLNHHKIVKKRRNGNRHSNEMPDTVTFNV